MPYFPVHFHQLPFKKVISDDDWMAKGKSSHGYFLRGYEALSTCHLAIKRAGVRVKDILDFGCGHGCVARMFKAQYPQATVYGQDVPEAWLDWCRENLGIETIKSPEKISDVKMTPDSFDVIWVGSVFTHIPEDAFDHLLSELLSALKKPGLLVFTTAGHKVRIGFQPGKEKLISKEGGEEALQQYDETGYGFTPYVGGTYDAWGRAIVTLDKVLEKIQKHDARLISFQEGGWGDRQDVYAVVK
jgi:SAM-dependent methyltransferase